MPTQNPNEQNPPKSPIRPKTDELNKRIIPTIPRPALPSFSHNTDPTPTQEIDIINPADQKVTEALERLRQKMSVVAEEYAEGKINRAQFDAIYHRYQEQREITEALVERNPETGAWQSVVQPGHTGFLRQYFEAKVLSYSIYHIKLGEQIIRNGHVQIPHEQIHDILDRLRLLLERDGIPQLAHRQLEDLRWVLFIPGRFSLSVVIFSTEPARSQIEMVKDMHLDFERANWQMLQYQRFDVREMVFPHRALFGV